MTDLGDSVYTPILSSAAVFDQYMQLGLGFQDWIDLWHWLDPAYKPRRWKWCAWEGYERYAIHGNSRNIFIFSREYESSHVFFNPNSNSDPNSNSNPNSNPNLIGFTVQLDLLGQSWLLSLDRVVPHIVLRNEQRIVLLAWIHSLSSLELCLSHLGLWATLIPWDRVRATPTPLHTLFYTDTFYQTYLEQLYLRFLYLCIRRSVFLSNIVHLA